MNNKKIKFSWLSQLSRVNQNKTCPKIYGFSIIIPCFYQKSKVFVKLTHKKKPWSKSQVIIEFVICFLFSFFFEKMCDIMENECYFYVSKDVLKWL